MKKISLLLLGLAVALASCTGTPHPPLPPVPTSASVTGAHQPKFLHEYELDLGVYPSSIVGGSDGAMWFGTYPYYTNHPAIHLGVARISLHGKVAYHDFGRGVYDVVENTDGNVWFTNPYVRPYTVGFITPGGTITQYDVAGGGDPESIAADPGGHLWFTRFGAKDDLWEIATSGETLAKYNIKSGNAAHVAYGNTGLMWFDVLGNPALVGRITPRGKRLAAIPGPSYIPGPMALGPDGRMWICDGGSVAAVDGALNVTIYSIPGGGGLDGITAGPDGNLWATDFINSAIVRITPSGVMTEYATPTPNMLPFAIGVGPDGNIWFTEIQSQTDVSKIGVLRP